MKALILALFLTSLAATPAFAWPYPTPTPTPSPGRLPIRRVHVDTHRRLFSGAHVERPPLALPAAPHAGYGRHYGHGRPGGGYGILPTPTPTPYYPYRR